MKVRNDSTISQNQNEMKMEWIFTLCLYLLRHVETLFSEELIIFVCEKKGF